MNLIFKDDILYIVKDDMTMTLDGTELRDITEIYNKEVYFRQDVMNRIEVLVNENELPESALNTEYINAVLEKYNDLRLDNDDVAEGKSWVECLDEAFDSVEYSE